MVNNLKLIHVKKFCKEDCSDKVTTGKKTEVLPFIVGKKDTEGKSVKKEFDLQDIDYRVKTLEAQILALEEKFKLLAETSERQLKVLGHITDFIKGYVGIENFSIDVRKAE